MSELSEAVERVRRVRNGESRFDVYYPCVYYPWLDQYTADLNLIAKAYLASHAEDDREPVTEEWLRDNGGEPNGDEIFIPIVVCGRTIHLRFRPSRIAKGFVLSILPSTGDDRVWLWSGATRGQVRKLLEALRGE